MQHIHISLENLHEEYKLDYIARSSNGSVLYQNGGSVLLASVCATPSQKDFDFLPLSVQYIEKAYAAHKFPPGFIKREGKPSEFEILTSRLIDRSLRPLFPKWYRLDTSIVVMVLSYDGVSDLQLNALNAAACALYTSNLPIESENPVCGVRIGRKNGAFLLNPTIEEMRGSELDLFVSGRGEELLMIEMKATRTNAGANELEEESMIQALECAKGYIQNATRTYQSYFAPHRKPSLNMDSIKQAQNEREAQILSLLDSIKARYHSAILNALTSMAKSESQSEIESLIAQAKAACDDEASATLMSEGIMRYKKQLVREMILESARRADGRALKEVRPISIESNILPFAHGSVLFTRGQTQALVSATLGGDNDAQSYEMLGSKSALKRRFLFHYNFPGFSVGEASMIGSVGRRELGHGNLARRALESSLPTQDRTIRLVSEILESNGSSSMASVCGGSLALCACGVEVDSLIAGVAMGLVTQGEKYAILTDISGLEDHDGDMDFKVAGGYKGITALQMDIKLGGISKEILQEALLQAREARLEILGIMESARARIVLNDSILPKSESFLIPPHKVVEVIGQGGRVIKDIIERFEVIVDLARESGEVRLSASVKENLEAAKAFILKLTGERESEQYRVGERFMGRIKRIMDFGVFVELPRGGDGLLHISKLTGERNARLEELLGGRSELPCEIVGINKGKIELGLADKSKL